MVEMNVGSSSCTSFSAAGTTAVGRIDDGEENTISARPESRSCPASPTEFAEVISVAEGLLVGILGLDWGRAAGIGAATATINGGGASSSTTSSSGAEGGGVGGGRSYGTPSCHSASASRRPVRGKAGAYGGGGTMIGAGTWSGKYRGVNTDDEAGAPRICGALSGFDIVNPPLAS